MYSLKMLNFYFSLCNLCTTLPLPSYLHIDEPVLVNAELVRTVAINYNARMYVQLICTESLV